MSLDWMASAVRLDGPAFKTGYGGDERALREGAVYHSMDGSLSYALEMLANPALAKSWTFSNPKQGQLIQHYPVGKHAWAAGSQDANEKFGSCESEGGGPGIESEPLTRNQIGNLVELTVWLYTTQEWATLTRRITMWEHKEMQRFGSRATACPSDRIPWGIIIAEAEKIISQEDDMTTYKLFQTWGPPKLWNIQYDSGVPMWRRWVVTPEGAATLIAAHGQPETIDILRLWTIPAL